MISWMAAGAAPSPLLGCILGQCASLASQPHDDAALYFIRYCVRGCSRGPASNPVVAVSVKTLQWLGKPSAQRSTRGPQSSPSISVDNCCSWEALPACGKLLWLATRNTTDPVHSVSLIQRRLGACYCGISRQGDHLERSGCGRWVTPAGRSKP